MKKSVKIICFMLTFIFILSGCGKKTEEELYIENMNANYEIIYNACVSINSPVSGNNVSSETILANIDTIKEAITNINSLKPPYIYSQVSEFSNAALNEISLASDIYHQIYSSPDFSSYDADLENQAYSHFTTAIDNLELMGKVMSVSQN